MRLCLKCGNTYADGSWMCPACRDVPLSVGGFFCFAPNLADGNESYCQDYFAEIQTLEADSFWFRNRNDLIVWALKRFAAFRGAFLEVGCGTGYVLKGLISSLPEWSFSGCEVSLNALMLAQRRLPSTEFIQADARKLPFREEFDALGAFDVLEHIVDHEGALASMTGSLRMGGRLFLTVPQHAWLWSEVDVFAHHVRRYSKSEIIELLRAVGLKPVCISSFMSLLLPALMASRFSCKSREGWREPELHLSSRVDRMLGGISAVERWLIYHGFRLPVGGSILIVAER